MKNISKHYGFYRAEVVQLLNNGFCRLRIPDILEPIDDNINTLPLAEPAQTIGGGADTLNGDFVYPEIGSIVWCFFEGGNLERPVYFATSNVRCTNWANVSVPTQVNSNEGNDGYSVLPTGQLMKFNKSQIQQKIIRDPGTGIPKGDEIDIKVESTAESETMHVNALNSGAGGVDSMPSPVAASVHLDNKRNIVSITAKDTIVLHAPKIMIDSTGFEKPGEVTIKSHTIENITDNGFFRVMSSNVNIDGAGNNVLIQTRWPGDVLIIDPDGYGWYRMLPDMVASYTNGLNNMIDDVLNAVSSILGKAGSEPLSNSMFNLNSLSDIPVNDVLNKLDEVGVLSGLDNVQMDELMSDFGEFPVDDALTTFGDANPLADLAGKSLADIVRDPSLLDKLKDKLSDVFNNINNIIGNLPDMKIKDVLQNLANTTLNDIMDKLNEVAGIVGGLSNIHNLKDLIGALNQLSAIVPGLDNLAHALEMLDGIGESLGGTLANLPNIITNLNQVGGLIGGLGNIGNFLGSVTNLNNLIPGGLSTFVNAIQNINSISDIANVLGNIPGLGNIANALTQVNNIIDMVGNVHNLRDALNCASSIASLIPGGFGGNILGIVSNINSLGNVVGGLGSLSSMAGIVSGLGTIGGVAGTIGSLTSLAGTFAAMTPMGMAAMVGANVVGSIVSSFMNRGK